MDRLPTTPVQRARLVAQWRVRGGSQADFARQHHVHPRTFWDWIRAHPPGGPPGEPAGPAEAPGPRFVAVRVEAPTPTGEAPLVIEVPGGLRVHVASGTCPTWVAAIAAGLRSSC
jgi:transposase-like protein